MKHTIQTSNKTHFRTFLLALAVLILSSCSKKDSFMPVPAKKEMNALTQSTGANTQNSVETVPFDRTIYVSCSNGGAGEDILMTGNMVVVYHATFNDRKYTLSYHTNPQGVTGMGLTSGDKYIVSGGSEGTISGAYENDQFAGGYTEDMRVISPKGTFIVHYQFHVTVTPDGKFTSEISDEKVVCRM